MSDLALRNPLRTGCATDESTIIRFVLIGVAAVFLGVILFLPLIAVFAEA